MCSFVIFLVSLETQMRFGSGVGDRVRDLRLAGLREPRLPLTGDLLLDRERSLLLRGDGDLKNAD